MGKDPSERGNDLERKLTSLKKFLAATEALRDHLAAGKFEEAERVLEQRQGLIRAIDGIDEQIRETRSKGDLKARRGILREIEETLGATRQVDQECVDQMTAWKKSIRGQLSRMREGLRATRGYRVGSVAPPRFLDVRR